MRCKRSASEITDLDVKSNYFVPADAHQSIHSSCPIWRCGQVVSFQDFHDRVPGRIVVTCSLVQIVLPSLSLFLLRSIPGRQKIVRNISGHQKLVRNIPGYQKLVSYLKML